MPAQIITTDDLYLFKMDLLDELRKLFGQHTQEQQKRWLKSAEVRRLLNISPGTLQHLRLTGILPYTKIGGTIYFNAADIETVMAKNLHKQKSLL